MNKVVTDGVIVYSNYEWRGKEIYNVKRNKPLKPYVKKDKGGSFYILSQKGKSCIRGKQLLYRHSYREMFEPKDLANWIDVFDYEQYYCFNPNNPNEIWSKRTLQCIQVATNNNKKSAHILFNVFKDRKYKTYYVHKMVWQSYNQQKVPKGYVVHHLNHNSFDNRIENMVLLPRAIHSVFEIKYTIYKQSSAFYKKVITKEELENTINKFDISEQIKQKLIENL